MLRDHVKLEGFGIDQSKIRNLRSKITIAHPDYWLMAIVAMLLVLGTVMVYSSSFVTAEFTSGNPSYYLWRHLLWLGVGLVGAGMMTLIDYHRLRRLSIAAMLIVLGLLLAILVLPSELAPSRFGAKRWITPMGSDSDWQFQPSELAKVVLVLYAAHWLSSKGDKVRNFYYGLVPFALTLGFLIGLVMGQPDLGTSLVIGCIGLSMFFIAGANVVHMLAGLGTAAAAFYVFSTTASYRLDRLKAYTDPFADPTGLTWHTSNNLIALGSGGLFGTGLGASRQKFLWLPNVFTDSIFAVIGEELGLLGAGLVVMLFVALAWRGLRIAAHAPDDFGRLIAAGVTIYIVSQALINIAVICNLVPFTGIPLPLISYGGTSLAVTMTGLGLLLNVSRQQIADPQMVLAEEVRIEEARKRELLREQRQAERERREAHRKLLEAEQAEHERQELASATKRWYDQRERQRTTEDWQDRAKQAQARRQAASETARARIREKEADTINNDNNNEEERDDLPAVASRSFLSFQSGIQTDLDGTEDHKPKLRKPRRDWAKVYEARRNQRD
jgi:cell division protein FtsW